MAPELSRLAQRNTGSAWPTALVGLVVGLAVLALVGGGLGCGDGPGRPVVVADTRRGVDAGGCCPIADPFEDGGCNPLGGARNPDGSCTSVCDSGAASWERRTDEAGCPEWVNRRRESTPPAPLPVDCSSFETAAACQAAGAPCEALELAEAGGTTRDGQPCFLTEGMPGSARFAVCVDTPEVLTGDVVCAVSSRTGEFFSFYSGSLVPSSWQLCSDVAPVCP